MRSDCAKSGPEVHASAARGDAEKKSADDDAEMRVKLMQVDEDLTTAAGEDNGCPDELHSDRLGRDDRFEEMSNGYLTRAEVKKSVSDNEDYFGWSHVAS